jgi:RNA polymerase sigma factor (sigma-70 family)
MASSGAVENPKPLDVDRMIESAAWSVRNRFKQWVDQEDLAQEGYLWVFEHSGRVQEYLDNENPKLAYWWLSRDLWEVMDKYARVSKAQAVGYAVSDEAFYGQQLIEALLPAVLAGDTDKPKGEQVGPRQQSDPAEGGNYLVMYLDVERAWEKTKLADTERLACELYYGQGYTQTETAEQLEISQPSVQKALKRALRKMVETLGGQRPSD